MKIGLFGGTFDPVHAGHLIIAETVRCDFGLDLVLFIPACIQPRKTWKPVADPESRLLMTRMAVEGVRGFGVSDAEIKRGGVSYMLDTLVAMDGSGMDGRRELFLIMGTDSLIDMKHWKEPDEILKRARLLIAARRGYDGSAADPRFQEKAVRIETPLVDISSTEIRRRIKNGLSVRFWVPDAVEKFIRERGLYC
jgi:nicotinate-nucleotide adenylyltransferase